MNAVGWLMNIVERPWFFWTARTLALWFVRLRFRLSVHDASRVPRDGGLVIASNHISGWDPPVVGVAVPRALSFMAKKELFDKPASRLLMRGLRAFPVDRSRSDVGAVKEAMRRLRNGAAIGVFAQGTRSDGDAEALDGAAYLAQRAKVPLQPVAIWREGRRFHVRFGEPMTVEGRSREAVRAATVETMRRVNEMIPGRERAFAPEDLAAPAEGHELGATGGAVGSAEDR